MKKGMNDPKVLGLLTFSIHVFVIVARCYYSFKDNQQHSEQQQEEKKQEQGEREEEKQEQEEREEEKQEQDKVWSWAELDRDVLGEIVSRLCLTDQARFRAVCTNWLAAAHLIVTNAKSSALPWHGCKYPVRHDFQIYDPLSSPNHLVSRHIIPWSEFGIPTSSSTVSVLDVQHNWLFIGVRKYKLLFWTRRWFLLFSPFTKTIISLPKFDYPRGFLFSSMFSIQPDSQDSVFCMVNTNLFYKIAVLTYRNGDKEWTSRLFSRHPDFPRCQAAICIIRGTIYIITSHGHVASYNILNGEFNFDRLLQDEFIVQNSCSREVEVFVLNEEVMILCSNKDVKDDATLPGQQFIRRYDPLLRVWIPVKTLGDYALVFRREFLKVLLINTKERTCKGLLPNKIYRFFDGGCRVYSLEDGQLVQFKSINSNLLEDGGADLPEYKYNYATPNTIFSYWLEAPRIRSSSDNQDVRSFRDEGKQGAIRALG